MMATLRPQFIDTILKVNGKTGEIWLENLDNLVAYCEDKWGFEVLQPYDLSFNFVAPVLFSNGDGAVLKLGVSPAAIQTEASVLQFFKGEGFCKLVDEETPKGILLLEKLNPGNNLSSIDEADACKVAARLIAKMQKQQNLGSEIFPSILNREAALKKFRDHFGGGSGPVSEEFVTNAETLLASLLSSLEQLKLFHGDFHHYNILSAGNDDWKMIDPKGLMSEPCCELAPFLMNNLKGKDLTETIQRRSVVFAKELNLPAERIINWGAVFSIISIWWLIEDGLPVTAHNLNVAETFYRLSRTV